MGWPNRYRTRPPLVGEICELAVSISTADFTLPGSARCLVATAMSEITELYLASLVGSWVAVT
jgi:hypothetical protein